MKIIDKPWGHEEILEINDHYVVKRLFLKKDQAVSLQYHKLKQESFYILSGQFLYTYGTDVQHLTQEILNVGDFRSLPPLMIHQMRAIQPGYYLESSTTQLDDVVRLQDDYGRV